MNPLQRLIADALDAKGLSQRQAAARSQGLLSGATLSRVAAGRTVNLTARTISGLALALDVEPSVVDAAAQATAAPLQLVELSTACARLPAAEQAEVVAFLRTKLIAHEAAEKARIKRTRPYRRGAH